MYDVLVVGGGINGLCAAWWAARRGLRVCVAERHAFGHDHGSSHGRSRITRSAYADPVYVALMQVAHAEGWPALERDVGVTLLYPRHGCFFGYRGGKFEDYVRALEGSSLPVSLLEAYEARTRFPAFRFPGDVAVIEDRTAAVVAAADTVAALVRHLGAVATLLPDTEVYAVDDRGADTARGRIEAQHVIVTAGAWLGRLVPTLRQTLRAVWQTVVYVDVQDAAALPVWAWRGEDDFFYGLPEFQRPGAKAALHRLTGSEDPEVPTPERTSELLAFLQEHLVSPPRAVLATERCLYTMAPDEDFVFDVVDGVVVGGGMSGHGFKFGPLTGRILVELAVDGRSTVGPFEAHRDRFRAR